MRNRCPSASFFCVAVLPGCRLDFTHYSEARNRNCWVADIVADVNEKVWGVVYCIDKSDIGNLDKHEGYKLQRVKNIYSRREIIVHRDGNKELPITAWIYEVVNKNLNNNKTSKAYMQKIIRGAQFWRLPAEYMKN